MADGQSAPLPWAVADGVQRGSVVGLIVRENLAAIGIDLEIRQFAYGTMFARVKTPTSRSTSR